MYICSILYYTFMFGIIYIYIYILPSAVLRFRSPTRRQIEGIGRDAERTDARTASPDPYIYIYIYIYGHTYVYTYIYIYIYIYIYVC